MSWSETTKLITTLGVYIKKYHGSHYYGKAINVTRRLVEAHNAVLTAYDLPHAHAAHDADTTAPSGRTAALYAARAGDDREHRALRHYPSPTRRCPVG